MKKISDSLGIKLAIVLQPTTLLCAANPVAAMDSFPGCKVAIYLHLVLKSLTSTTEELLERKSSGSSLESREYGCRGCTVLTT
jgi:hypothetical protein